MTAEPVMVSIKWKMIQVEKSQPVFLGYGCMTAYSIVLICDPNNQNYVKSSSGIFKKFRHYCLHSWKKEGKSLIKIRNISQSISPIGGVTIQSAHMHSAQIFT